MTWLAWCRRKLRLPAWLVGLVVLLPLLWLDRNMLDAWSLPERGSPEMRGIFGDLTPQFAVWHHIISTMVGQEHVFPLWNRFTFAGEPFFAKPQVAVVATGTLLGLVFPFPVSLKLDMLLHLFLASWGMVVLARFLGASRVLAWCCASLVLLSHFYVFHVHTGHLNILQGWAWLPWTWLCVLRTLPARRGWERHAARAALLLAVQLYDGADVTLLYGCLALGLACLGHVAVAGVAWLRHALMALVVMALGTLGAGLFRLWALGDFLAVSNRQLGVPWPDAGVGHEPLPVHAVPWLAAVLCLGVVASRRREWGLVAGWSVASILGWWLPGNPALFKVLHQTIPLFSAQRQPERGEIMVVMCVPVLLAITGAALRRRWRRAWWWHMGFTAACALAVWVSFRNLPAPPNVADIRVERAANAFIAEVARRTGTSGDRLNLMENQGRHWGIEHVTEPAGVENVVGYEPTWTASYLSPQFYMPLQVSFLDMAAKRPARTWGLVSGRWIGSTVPRQVAGLEFRTVVEKCPPRVCQPSKSGGPYLFENMEALPRMFAAQAFAVFVGRGREADLAWQALLLDDAWKPDRVAFLRAEHLEDVPPQPDLVVVHGPGGAEIPGAKRVVDAEHARGALQELSDVTPPITPLEMTRDGQVYGACGVAGKVLVASSKHASVGGWRALDETGARFPMWVANGAATAVPVVDAGGVHAGKCVRLEYRPAWLLWGAPVSVVVALVLVWLGFLRRRGGAGAALSGGGNPVGRPRPL